MNIYQRQQVRMGREGVPKRSPTTKNAESSTACFVLVTRVSQHIFSLLEVWCLMRKSKRYKRKWGCSRTTLSRSVLSLTGHVWRWVIVPPEFFVAKFAKLYRLACGASVAWTSITHTLKLSRGKHAERTICADSSEWPRQIPEIQ